MQIKGAPRDPEGVQKIPPGGRKGTNWGTQGGREGLHGNSKETTGGSQRAPKKVPKGIPRDLKGVPMGEPKRGGVPRGTKRGPKEVTVFWEYRGPNLLYRALASVVRLTS